MKISIVVPVYQVVQWIETCVDSLLSQTYTDYEVILVDDCSTDGSESVCDRYASDSRVTVVHRKVNGGLSAARNTGIDLARGEFITFVDSDDFIAPDTLAAIAAAVGDDVDIVEYPISIGYGVPGGSVYRNNYGTGNALDCWTESRGYFHCYSANKAFRRTLWDDIRFPEGKCYEDVFTVPQLIARARRICFAPTGMYYYCRRDGSISTTYTVGNLTDFVTAEIALMELLKTRPTFDGCRTDELFITICNWQAMLLRLGGNYLLPRHKVSLPKMLRSDCSAKIKVKTLLYALLGNSYCRLLAKTLK
ncbi:MAG: glycosyltransferase family 2 protein [Candidatus Limisoma sp.]